MKKGLICIIIGALVLTVSACGDSVDTDKLALPTEEDVQQMEVTAAEEAAQAATEGTAAVEEDADTAASEIVETAGEEAEEELPDVTTAMDGAKTSEKSAVPLGEWVQTTLYATQDKTYHTVYVRLVKVTTRSVDETAVDAAIDTHNLYCEAENRINLEELVPEGEEAVVADYDVFVPAYFPAPNYGMPEPKLYISIRGIGESGMKATQPLVVRKSSEAYYPGHVYRERCLYTQKTGNTEYMLTYSSYPEGTLGSDTSAENMYTVYHSIKAAEPEPEETTEETAQEE